MQCTTWHASQGQAARRQQASKQESPSSTAVSQVLRHLPRRLRAAQTGERQQGPAPWARQPEDFGATQTLPCHARPDSRGGGRRQMGPSPIGGSCSTAALPHCCCSTAAAQLQLAAALGVNTCRRQLLPAATGAAAGAAAAAAAGSATACTTCEHMQWKS